MHVLVRSTINEPEELTRRRKMPSYFAANGFTPRTIGEAQGRQNLQTWLQQRVQSGFFQNRPTVPPSPWRWEERIQPTHSGALNIPGADSRAMLRNIEQKLFDDMQIHMSAGGFSKGYVTSRSALQYREQQEVRRGQPGGPFNPEQPERPDEFVFWDIVRCLPETSQEARQWGYHYENEIQWQVILLECRRYNRTLRDRLVSGYSAGRAHASAVTAMREQSTRLLYEFAIMLALSAGTVGHAPVLSFGSPPSDFHGRQPASVAQVNPFR